MLVLRGVAERSRPCRTSINRQRPCRSIHNGRARARVRLVERLLRIEAGEVRLQQRVRSHHIPGYPCLRNARAERHGHNAHRHLQRLLQVFAEQVAYRRKRAHGLRAANHPLAGSLRHRCGTLGVRHGEHPQLRIVRRCNHLVLILHPGKPRRLDRHRELHIRLP